MSKPSSDHGAGGAADRGYGKIDTRKARDITTEAGKSQGKENNPGDFGNEPAGGERLEPAGKAGTRIKGRERGTEAALEAESGGGGASELEDESR